MVFELMADSLLFPDPYDGEEDGLIAIGGDLSPERLLLAYSMGIFPWYSFHESSRPEWYCPLERFVIFPEEIHVSHSMRTLINRGEFHVTFNEDFAGVIRGCSSVNDRCHKEGAWLGEDIIEAYTELYRRGFARSVEVWQGDSLAGGLYGVTIGHVFAGESMFAEVSGASKLALISLARELEKYPGTVIDCQFETPHLLSMGGRHISYQDYLRYLRYPAF